MTEIEHLLSKALTKMEQELTTTQGKHTEILQAHKKDLLYLKEQFHLMQKQTNVQNERLQNLSNAYENLLPLLEKLNNILPKN